MGQGGSRLGQENRPPDPTLSQNGGLEMDRKDKYIDSFRKMIRLDTVSDPTNGSPRGNFDKFHELMWELFPNIKNACEVRDFNGSILMKWKGSDSTQLPVLFMNHHDVVPAKGDGWKYPPFSAELAEGKIWGRGTLDDKGGLFAMLQAADELAAEGFVPARDIYFESGCNEETFGEGADTISKWLKDQGIRFEMVFDEGGDIVIEPISGAKGTFAMIGVGEKSVVNLKFTARSDGGHASTPGKNTPIVRLGKFMAYVDKHQVFDVKMPDAIAEMLARIAPYMGAKGKLLGQTEKLKKPLGALMPMLGPTTNALVSTTIAFTLVGGGEAVNAIPREAWVIGDMRCSHHQGKQASVDAITKVAAKFGLETEIIEESRESGLADFRGKAFRLAEEAAKACVPGVNRYPSRGQ